MAWLEILESKGLSEGVNALQEYGILSEDHVGLASGRRFQRIGDQSRALSDEASQKVCQVGGMSWETRSQ